MTLRNRIINTLIVNVGCYLILVELRGGFAARLIMEIRYGLGV